MTFDKLFTFDRINDVEAFGVGHFKIEIGASFHVSFTDTQEAIEMPPTRDFSSSFSSSISGSIPNTTRENLGSPARQHIGNRRQYTTIGGIFRFELFIIKLLGGFMFETNRYIGVIYRCVVIILIRYIDLTSIIDYNQRFASFDTLNVRILIIVHLLSLVVLLITSIITGFKYNNLLLVILKKRLDRKYISWSHGEFSNLDGYFPETSGSFALLPAEAKPSLRIFSGFKRSLHSRINQFRVILLVNLIFAAISGYCRDRVVFSKDSGDRSANGLANTTSTQSSSSSINFLVEVMRKKNIFPGNDRIFTESYFILLEAIRAAVNIYQAYGNMLIDFMITAVLTEMLSFSANYDRITHNERVCMKKIYSIDGTNHRKSLKRGKLLTSELLIQIRDVLLTVGRTMDTNYLFTLIFDVTRLMLVFCLFTVGLSDSNIKSPSILIVDYLRVSFNILLSRLGYFWLHTEVRKIKHALVETKLLSECDKKEITLKDVWRTTNRRGSSDNIRDNFGDLRGARGSQESAGSGDSVFSEDNSSDDDLPGDSNIPKHQIIASHAEIITSYKLADQIENMWPTDWFKPDIKNYLSQNIFVVTFVATLQQLVETASTKADST